MKRVLSLVLAFMLVLTSIMPAFAEESMDSQAGKDLESYGVIAGTDNGLDEKSPLTRAQMAVIWSQMYGMKEEAAAYAFAPSFTDVAEGEWYTPYIAFAEQKGWMTGDAAGGTFRPNDTMSAQAINATFVKALGYDVEWADVNAKAAELGFAVSAADESMVLRGEAFATMVEVLNTPKMNETDTLGTALALPNYEPPTAPAPDAVAVKSAKSLNANVVEVVLDSANDLAAPTAVNVEQFKVTDDDDAVLEISKVEFAPWDADNYTVLVTVADDMAAGSLYNVASGDASADFGGLADDTTKPAIDDATSNDYNEVKVTLSEAVLLDDVTVKITEKYGDKEELAVLDFKYSGNSKIMVTTAEQADATLYEVEIDGLVDLAGNEAKDLTATFTGQEKNTNEQTVGSASAVDSVTIDVTFDINVDVEAAEDAANYTIKAKYGDKEEVAVASAAMKTDSDGDVIKNVVRLTLAEDTKDATLYEVTVDNVGTLYGKGLDSDNDSTTFTGKGPDTDEPTGFTASADNNTSVTLTITDDSEIAEEYDVALFTIKEKYGDKEELAVIAVDDVDAEAKTITLTTAEQKGSTLYEVTIAEGLADKFGNVTDDELTNTFTGASVADEISTITAVNTADKKVRVDFDQKYGDNALSVASYSIDGGIGYPSKVEKISGDKDSVLLTISQLKVGKVYTLTVKNVYNSDGVAMDKDGLTDKFGAVHGNSDTDITLEAAVAQNNQTITLYFNDNVANISGLLNPDNELESGALSIKKEADADSDYVQLTGYAYAHPEFDTRLVVTVTDNDAFDNADDDEFYIKINGTQVTNIETDDTANVIKFAENTSEPTEIKVSGIVALDDQTLKVYFNQAVRKVEVSNTPATDFAKVNGEFDSTAGADDVGFSAAYPLNTEKTEWKFVLASPMTSDTANELNFVVVDEDKVWTHALANGNASALNFENDDNNDYAGNDGTVVPFDITPTSNKTVEFSKNTDSKDYINDIGVVMQDSKTVKIIFPEWMADNAFDITNHQFFTTSGGSVEPAYTQENGSTEVAADDSQIDITRAVYEENKDGTSIVYLTLEDTFGISGTSYSKLYWTTPAASITNKAGNKAVEKNSDSNQLYKEFSVNTGAATDVAVSRVEASASADTVTIRLDQPLRNIGSDEDLLGASYYNSNKATFAGEFVIKVDGVAIPSAQIVSIVANNVNKTTEDGTDDGNSAAAAGNDGANDATEIVVTYNDGYVIGGKDVEVKVSDSETSPVLRGLYNFEDLKDNSDAVRSVVADTVAPELADGTDGTDNATSVQAKLAPNTIYKISSTVLTADGTTDIKGLVDFTSTLSDSVVISSITLAADGTLTITLSIDASTVTEVTGSLKIDLDQITDNAGNKVVNDTTAANTVITITDSGATWADAYGAN